MKIKNEAELRKLYNAPKERAVQKQMSALDQHAINFIGLSPFMILSSCNNSGQMDTSPRGGKRGFVQVLDNRTIIIPDSKGNNRLDSLVNIIETGRASTMFLIPGIDETLRINGHAHISTDEKLLNLFSREKNLMQTCIVIEIKELFLHCAKALMRSKLWLDESKVERNLLPSMGQMLKDQIGSEEKPESHEDMIKRYTPDL